MLAVTLFEIAGSEVNVFTVVSEQVIDDAQNAVGDGDDGALLAATSGQPVVLAGKVRVLGELP